MSSHPIATFQKPTFMPESVKSNLDLDMQERLDLLEELRQLENELNRRFYRQKSRKYCRQPRNRVITNQAR